MNMPGFNADATLHKTSGHYQTSRNMINLPTQMIYPAEMIEVTGCRPGYLQLGEGDEGALVSQIRGGLNPGPQLRENPLPGVRFCICPCCLCVWTGFGIECSCC